MSSLEDCFQLKSEWVAVGTWQGIREYRHLHSRQEIELRSFASIDIKQLDIFTSRENYSFLYCPKIYKCNIIKSQCHTNAILFDIALISEKLINKPNNHTFKKMQMHLEQIVLGFEYLLRRYGAFVVTGRMIQWNQYNIPKVWFNQNFLSNLVSQPAQSEQQMVRSILTVLQDMFDLKFTSKSITMISSLIDTIDKGHYKKNEGEKKVKFDRAQTPRCPSSNKSSENIFPRKNNKITFVYSNKTIHSKGHQMDSLKSVTDIKQTKPTFFQFDKRSKRSKSSNQSINHRADSFKSKVQIIDPSKHYQSSQGNKNQVYSLQDLQNKANPNAEPIKQQIAQAQKQNLQFSRRKSNTKKLTCNISDAPPTLVRHHSRRYSNSVFQEQINLMEAFSKTDQKFMSRRKQSILREQLQQCLDGLFGSQCKVAQFDESQLQKQLQGVL